MTANCIVMGIVNPDCVAGTRAALGCAVISDTVFPALPSLVAAATIERYLRRARSLRGGRITALGGWRLGGLTTAPSIGIPPGVSDRGVVAIVTPTVMTFPPVLPQVEEFSVRGGAE